MIIWLASYPKSGNTFLRSILSSYFFSETGDFNFDLLKRIDQFPNPKIFKLLGIDLKKKNEIEKNYIAAQKLINKENKSVQFWKTHSSFCKFDNKYDFTDLINTAGVIYIVRDPRNVVLSYSHHFQKTIDDSLVDLNSNLAIQQSKNDYISVLVGSWNFNYNSWKQLKPLNKYLLIRYEDLINNTEKTLINVLDFIKRLIKGSFQIDLVKLKKSIESTQFDKLKNLEEKNGFTESKINKKGEKIKFFNLGPKNDWKSLDSKIRVEIEKSFESEMREIGYL